MLQEDNLLLDFTNFPPVRRLLRMLIYHFRVIHRTVYTEIVEILKTRRNIECYIVYIESEEFPDRNSFLYASCWGGNTATDTIPMELIHVCVTPRNILAHTRSFPPVARRDTNTTAYHLSCYRLLLSWIAKITHQGHRSKSVTKKRQSSDIEQSSH